jgi:hypothetical protein
MSALTNPLFFVQLYAMSTTTPKRLVIDLSHDDHASLKALAASSNTSIRSLVLQSIQRELTARRAALVRPAPRAPQ